MGAAFKIGQKVAQVMPKPIEGTVLSLAFNGDDIQYEVEYVDAAGATHIQPFTEEELVAPTTTGA